MTTSKLADEFRFLGDVLAAAFEALRRAARRVAETFRQFVRALGYQRRLNHYLRVERRAENRRRKRMLRQARRTR